MDRLRIILDTTHLTDKGFFEAMEYFRWKGLGQPSKLQNG